MIVLSYYQTHALVKFFTDGEIAASISPDLGLSEVGVELDADGVRFPGGERLSWSDAEEISAGEGRCYLLDNEGIQQIRVYSSQTNWSRNLHATEGAPTVVVSGFPMHRIKNTDPMTDTLAKIAAVAPIRGRVLDTATGLGYTAIEAARTASEVVTVELDPAALAICRLNPWSAALFDNPKIGQIVDDVYDAVDGFDDGEFDVVIHDPPTINIAGDLYSEAFYRKLHRVTARRGRVFHYVGDPTSRNVGRVTTGVIRRLQSAGFEKVVRKQDAFGIVAYK